MLDIQRFVCNMFQENCYVVSDETKECVIIDCGAFFEEEKIAIYNYINDNNLTPKHLLCTHGHVDHNFGNKFILDKFGLLPEISEADKPLMNNLGKQAKAFTGEDCGNDFPEIGRFYENDKTIYQNTTAPVINDYYEKENLLEHFEIMNLILFEQNCTKYKLKYKLFDFMNFVTLQKISIFINKKNKYKNLYELSKRYKLKTNIF